MFKITDPLRSTSILSSVDYDQLNYLFKLDLKITPVCPITQMIQFSLVKNH